MTDQLEQIEFFAYRYLELSEVAEVTGVEIEQLKDFERDEAKAFRKGRLKRKAQFNENLMKLSDQLSSPAMAIEQKIADKIFINDNSLR